MRWVGHPRPLREVGSDMATSQVIMTWITLGGLSMASLPWAGGKS